jgi:enoyl-CoA hydratase/carnithine racemase
MELPSEAASGEGATRRDARVTVAYPHHEAPGAVAVVTLDRPEKLNALDAAMFSALIETAAALRERTSLRAVVLTGAGRGFSAGLDVAVFASLAGTRGSGARDGEPAPVSMLDGALAGVGNRAQQAALVWRALPVPVIAAVHGVAYGGGLQIALGADVRIVAPDARLSLREVMFGLVPDMGATQTLRDLVRLDVAKELVLTGRVVLGEEAVALGLATRCAADPLAVALSLAAEIAGRSPRAVRTAKRLFESAWRADWDEGLRLEAAAQRELVESEEQRQEIRARLEVLSRR